MPSSELLDLRSGQVALLPTERGVVVHVEVGNIMLSGPLQWLAERTYALVERLGPGDVYVADHNGWIKIDALAVARISISQPAKERDSGALKRTTKVCSSITRRLMNILSRSVH